MLRYSHARAGLKLPADRKIRHTRGVAKTILPQ